MNNFKIKLKVVLLHFFGYFFLLNGLRIMLSLKNISLVKVLRNDHSVEDKIAEIQTQNPNQSAGMLISDFVFFTGNLPYFLILLGFFIVWVSGKRKSTFCRISLYRFSCLFSLKGNSGILFSLFLQNHLKYLKIFICSLFLVELV